MVAEVRTVIMSHVIITKEIPPPPPVLDLGWLNPPFDQNGSESNVTSIPVSF